MACIRGGVARGSRWSRRVLAALSALMLAVLWLQAGAAPAHAQRPTHRPMVAATTSTANRLVGWDTYRRLDLLPYLTTGAETRQFSSFDRTGGNDYDGFDGRYTCRRTTAEGCVLAEDTGAGEISSIWFTRYGGDVSTFGQLKVVLDGQTVVNANLQLVVDGALGTPFTYPLVANASQSSGGVYIKVPMPYRTSMRVTVENNNGFYHLSYRRFADATGVATFNPADRADDVLAKLQAAGTADPKPRLPWAVTQTRTLNLAPGQQAAPVNLTGPGVITALRLKVPQVVGHDPASDERLAKTRLRISFDGRPTVDAPVGEFFGSGLGEYSVRSLLFAMDPAAGGWYSAWWPMPYANGASVTLVNGSTLDLTSVQLQITSGPDSQWTAALAAGGDAGRFTALSRRADAEPGSDWIFAELGGRGKFVGVSHTMNGADSSGWGRTYLEGDERVYADNSLSPQIYGTGTEDFYEGGWYFDHGPFSAPLTGQSAHETRADGCQYECDAAYRIMLSDSVAYRTRLRFGIEHGGTDFAPASYGSTAFLYTQPTKASRQTDLLDVGDPDDRTAHAYSEASFATQTDLSAVFEGDNDNVTVTDQVRSTDAPVSFRLAVDPANQGATLRRTGDQYNGYQTARVLVDGTAVGTWTQALNNVQQRWLEDSFPLPPNVTSGKSAITVRLEPEAGAPAWTAARYVAISVVPPVRSRSAGATDFDGDGRDDVVAFTQGTTADVFVAKSTGASFGPRVKWHDSFAAAGERPLTGDFDGDGRDDIVSFTQGSQQAVDVALSTGSSFGPKTRWHDHFSASGETPVVGDVNGDGRDDIMTFAHADPWAVASVALSTGTAFGQAQQWYGFFSFTGEEPALADVNGDGRDDFVTFTHGSPWAVVYVALSTGSTFADPQQWHVYFSAAGEAPRVGDVNDDGLADILTFTQGTEADVYAALSTGVSFGQAEYWHGYFAPSPEYPYVGDFDGNGLTDVVTFTRNDAADVFVATSNGWSFGWGYQWHDNFGFAGETVL